LLSKNKIIRIMKLLLKTMNFWTSFSKKTL
jgi:hypothetical protein